MKYNRLTYSSNGKILFHGYNNLLTNRLFDLENQIERGELIAQEEVEAIKAENTALRERLEKAVELPVKIGDTVYFIPTYNGKPIWGVQKGVVQMVGITQRGYHVKIRDRADFNKTYMFGKSAFLLKEQAEARLAELKGEKG